MLLLTVNVLLRLDKLCCIRTIDWVSDYWRCDSQSTAEPIAPLMAHNLALPSPVFAVKSPQFSPIFAQSFISLYFELRPRFIVNGNQSRLCMRGTKQQQKSAERNEFNFLSTKALFDK